MSPPASPGETSQSGAARVFGSGWVPRRLRQLWGTARQRAQPDPVPSEVAARGLTEQRRRLVDRYTIDAATAESRGLATVAEPEMFVQEVPAVLTAGRETERIRAGTLTALFILSSATGLMLVSAADALSRSGHKHGGVLFWLGLLAIFLPVTARLTSSSPTRNERVGLLVLLGFASYLVKVFRDPFRFLYADEFVHQYNAVSIVATRSLFHENPILPATPSYPGLEGPTAALATMTGVSTFTAGLVVIAVARLIMMLALFLLYETVTGSCRVAGLAAALYAASPHYLFFDADFSYESLALPIALLALVAVLRARPPAGSGNRAWLIAAVMLTAGVVVTHHMTSYALIITLLGICLVPLPWLRRQPRRPWTAAAVAIALTAGWLVLVASKTVGYLSPVILGALHETIRTFQGEAKVRQLFGSSAGATTGPAWEHYVAFLSAAIVAVAVPLGARVIWRRFRDLPAAIVFVVAAVAYVGSLALRLVPAAWPIAARASEFLFVGGALTLALFALWMLERFHGRPARACLVLAAALLLIGNVISTTPSSSRLAQPYRVSVRGGDVVPQAETVAQWASKELGPGNRVAAQAADGRFLLVDGRQHIFVGSNPPIAQILKTKVLAPWQIAALRRARIRYVVTDSHPSGADVANGYYFSQDRRDRRLALAARKFQQAGAEPIYDSGDIVVYDLQPGLRAPLPPQRPHAHRRRR